MPLGGIRYSIGYRIITYTGALALWLAQAGCDGRALDEGAARVARAASTVPLVTSERDLDSPVFGPSASLAWGPQVAYDGSTYLVTWQDRRADRAILRAARVSAGGFVLDPFGIPVTEQRGEEVRIAAGGGVFMVVFMFRSPPPKVDPDRIVAVRVDPAAGLLDPIPLELGAGQSPSVGYDGTQFVVFWNAEGRLRRARITPAGEVLDPGGVELPADLAQGVYQAPAVACAGDGHCAVSWLSEGASIHGTVLDAQGNPGSAGVQVLESLGDYASANVYMTTPRIAYDGSNYAVAWVVSTSYSTVALPAPEAPATPAVQAVAPRQGLRARRIDPRGAVVDADLVTISSYFTKMGDFVFDGTQFVAFGANDDWCNETMHLARWNPASQEPAPDIPNPVLPGEMVAMAAGDSRTLVVWRDAGLSGDFRHAPIISGAWIAQGQGVLESAPFPVVTTANTQEQPSAAFDGYNYLVAWVDSRENSAGDFTGIHATRVTPAGQVLDPIAIEIVAGPAMDDRSVQIVFDGRNTLVLWGEQPTDQCHNEWWNMRAVRVSPLGEVLDATPLDLGVDFWFSGQFPLASNGNGSLLLDPVDDQRVLIDQDGVVTGPLPLDVPDLNDKSIAALASDGAGYLLLLHDRTSYDPNRHEILGVRLNAQGVAIDTAAFSIGQGSGPIEAGFDGSNYVVFWQHVSGLRAARITPAGEVLDPDGIPVAGTESACPSSDRMDTAAVVFDGIDTLLAWQTRPPEDEGPVDLMGAALAPDGTVGPCFVLADGPENEMSPALASTGLGTSLLVYTRFVAGAPFDTRRVRARFLDSGAGVLPCPNGRVVGGVCMPDAPDPGGTPDAGAPAPGTDAGPGQDPGAGQDGGARSGGCQVAGGPAGAASGAAWLVLALGFLLGRRRAGTSSRRAENAAQ